MQPKALMPRPTKSPTTSPCELHRNTPISTLPRAIAPELTILFTPNALKYPSRTHHSLYTLYITTKNAANGHTKSHRPSSGSLNHRLSGSANANCNTSQLTARTDTLSTTESTASRAASRLLRTTRMPAS